jgi:hypothetical protein
MAAVIRIFMTSSQLIRGSRPPIQAVRLMSAAAKVK